MRRRRTRLERLESRELLAGDCFEALTDPASLGSIDPVISVSEYRSGGDVASASLSVTSSIVGKSTLGRTFALTNPTAGLTIVEFDPGDGTALNSFAAPPQVAPGPDAGLAQTSTTVLVAGRSLDPIYELDPDNGALIRTIANPGIDVSGLTVIGNELFVESDNGTLTVIDLTTESVTRTLSTGGMVEGLASDGIFLYGMNASAMLHRIDAFSGAASPIYPLRETNFGEGLAVFGEELFVSDGNEIDVYDFDTGIYSRSLPGFTDSEGISASDAVPVFDFAPTANDETFMTSTNTAIVLTDFDLGANDFDPEGFAISISPISSPSNGTLTELAPGVYQYDPEADFVGIDSFDYEVFDGGLTNVATATIRVGVIDFPTDLFDADGFRWDIQGDGTIADGTNDAYDSGFQHVGFAFTSIGAIEADGRQVVIGPQAVDDVEVTRKVYVPNDQSFARYLEIISNPTAGAVTYTVSIVTNPGSDALTTIVSTSSGDATLTAGDDWLVTDDADGSGDPTLAHVVSGPGGIDPDSFAVNVMNEVVYEYTLTLEPGETQIVMHFGAQTADRATAINRANDLRNLGPSELAGMTQAERDAVVNFDANINSQAFLHGTKFQDDNGNGVRDEGEPGLPGVELYLDLDNDGVLGLGEPVTVSMDDDPMTAGIDETGRFEFNNLFDGLYTVREVIPEGFVQTGPVIAITSQQETFPLGPINAGVAAQETNVGTGWLMYSEENVFTRFAAAPPLNQTPYVNSNHIVAVRRVGSQWQYDTNNAWVNFTPVDNDRLLASVNYTADTVTSLEGTNTIVAGIAAGYVSGDLTFIADQFDGEFNNAEFTVTGTSFTVIRDSRPRVVGAINGGIAAQEANTGEGFVMHSPENLFTRFAAAPPLNDAPFVNANQLIIVRWTGAQWQYDNNDTWTDFTPIAGDRLLATVDFDADTITSLEGTLDVTDGIASGYLDGDLTFVANQFAGVANPNEFSVSGTFFTIPNSSVTVQDGAYVAEVVGQLSVSELDFANQFIGMDFGDAPASYGTLLIDDGPRHNNIGPHLGSARDAETDGQPSAASDADELQPNGAVNDEEQGIRFLDPLFIGLNSLVEVVASEDSFLDGFVDFNSDGDFDDAGEKVLDSVFLAAGVNLFSITTPASAIATDLTHARFRVSELGGLDATGFADNGEVEDYAITIEDLFDPRRVFLNNVGSGISVHDNATGTGWIMYSREDLYVRFEDAPPYSIGNLQSDNDLIAVRLNGSQWQYSDNQTWIDFTPVTGDHLIAAVDFDADTIAGLSGIDTTIAGIPAGYRSTDIVFVANYFANSINPGEFQLFGSYFTVATAAVDPVSFNVGSVNAGVAAQDDATGTGYLMYSEQNVFARFAADPPYNTGRLRNADHMVAVRFNDGVWQYDNNDAWIDFTPEPTDRLLAELDFDADTVTSLEGTSSVVAGVDAGYSSGDLSFTADRFNSVFNDGDFTVEGHYFIVGNANIVTTSVGPLGRGVAVQDDAIGTGFLMFSATRVFDRFSPSPLAAAGFQNADHIVAVRFFAGQWQYNNNDAWFGFTPESDDRLLAEVDFDDDTVSALRGRDEIFQGVALGYLDGDLEFIANQYGGVENIGDFTVTGTFFATL